MSIYAIVDLETKKVVNSIVLDDTQVSPPIPSESERPEEPVLESLVEIPKPGRETGVIDAAAEAEYVRVMSENANKIAKYEQEWAGYLQKISEFQEKVKQAYRYRYTPPDGCILVKSDAPIGAEYINGQFIVKKDD